MYRTLILVLSLTALGSFGRPRRKTRSLSTDSSSLINCGGSSQRFRGRSNGWGFFTFGHHPLPYAETAAESSISECAGCHMANVAKTDMTWVQFYPILRGKQ
jgi:hypothetical protein